jgi:short subunit dehydrogenase-like uncharacterized protein
MLTDGYQMPQSRPEQPWILYGANGFTGAMIARHAAQTGSKPILAGRDPSAVAQIAEECGLQWRAFDLHDSRAIRAGLADVSAVVNAAGPFAFTYQPLLAACLNQGVHYLDISGEVDTFERCAKNHDTAAGRGVMVMPGIGFDMVPGDCLALHLKNKLPQADTLEVALRYGGSLSRGTSKSALLTFGQGVQVRRFGELTTLTKPLRRHFDFGDGPEPTVTITFADVSVSWRTTGIPNITVYALETDELRQLNSLPRPVQRVMALKPVKALMAKRLDRLPDGPSQAEIAEHDTRLVAIATDPSGRTSTARLTMPQIYRVTARLVTAIAERVVGGDVTPGYRTPAAQFGSDFITSIDGCVLEDGREVLRGSSEQHYRALSALPDLGGLPDTGDAQPQ